MDLRNRSAALMEDCEYAGIGRVIDPVSRIRGQVIGVRMAQSVSRRTTATVIIIP